MFANFSRSISLKRLKVHYKGSFMEVVRNKTKINESCSSDVPHKKLNTSKRTTTVQDESCREFPDLASRMVKIIPGKGLPPEPPTCCCSTGCQNCVWIQYVDELTEYYKDGGEESKRAIEQISDESIKAFVKMMLTIKL